MPPIPLIPAPLPTDRIVFLGDSITDGETHLILARQAFHEAGIACPTLINSGISGDTTAALLGRLERDAFSHNPTHAVLMIGVNDAVAFVDVDTHRARIGSIVNGLRRNNIHVTIATPPPVISVHAERSALVEKYVIEQRDLARRENVALIDTHDALAAAAARGIEILEGDGMHANFAGYRVMARTLLDAWGLRNVAVPDVMHPTAMPGLITPWRLRPVEHTKPFTAADLAPPTPDDASWSLHTVPIATSTMSTWWLEQERARGFVLTPQPNDAKRFVGFAVLNSDADRELYLNTGGHLRAIWFNGERVFETNTWTGFHPGKERIRVRARRGENIVMVDAGRQFFLSATPNRDW